MAVKVVRAHKMNREHRYQRNLQQKCKKNTKKHSK